MFTAAEIAAILKVSTREVRRFTASGALAVYRLGRAVRVAEADLERFLRQRREDGKK